MADIFLSYASPDRDRARLLAGALEHLGWSVWWDRVIPPGSVYAEVIEESLTAARCVIVLWSTSSVASDWVKTEAADAATRRVLVPALLDRVKIPLEFRRLQAADLTAWAGATDDAEFQKLVASVTPFFGHPVGIIQPQRASESPTRRHLFGRAWAIAATAAVVLLFGAAAFWKRTGDVVVPSLIGQRLDQAKSTIATSNLTASDVTEEPTATQTAGIVLKQDPVAGKEVKRGTPVTLVVAAAPQAAGRSGSVDSPIDLGIGALPFSVAFDVKELAMHVMFVPDDSALGGLLSAGASGPGGMVIRLDPGPVMNAGVRAGDVITAIAGAPIRSEDDLRQALKKVGDGLTQFRVKRGSHDLRFDVECRGCD